MDILFQKKGVLQIHAMNYFFLKKQLGSRALIHNYANFLSGGKNVTLELCILKFLRRGKAQVCLVSVCISTAGM